MLARCLSYHKRTHKSIATGYILPDALKLSSLLARCLSYHKRTRKGIATGYILPQVWRILQIHAQDAVVKAVRTSLGLAYGYEDCAEFFKGRVEGNVGLSVSSRVDGERGGLDLEASLLD